MFLSYLRKTLRAYWFPSESVCILVPLGQVVGVYSSSRRARGLFRDNVCRMKEFRAAAAPTKGVRSMRVLNRTGEGFLRIMLDSRRWAPPSVSLIRMVASKKEELTYNTGGRCRTPSYFCCRWGNCLPGYDEGVPNSELYKLQGDGGLIVETSRHPITHAGSVNVP